MKKKNALFRHRETDLPAHRRLFEYVLWAGVMSIAAGMVGLIATVFYVGFSKPMLGRLMATADLRLGPFLVLALFWWVTLAVIMERQANQPGEPQEARRLNQRLGRALLMAPLTSLMLASLVWAVMLPAVNLAIFGEDIRLVARVDKIGIEKEGCAFALLAHPPIGEDFELCVSSRLLGQFRPGDGLEYGARVWKGILMPKTPRRLPPEDIWADGALPPDVARAVVAYETAQKKTADGAAR